MKNNKYGLLILTGAVFAVLSISNGTISYADSVTANTESDLISLINGATEDRTITLSDSFPTSISSTIQLVEATANNITIEGNGKVLAPNGANPVIRYSGGGASSPGSLTIRNLSFNGNGSASRALYVDGYQGTFTLDNSTVTDFHASDDGGAMFISGNTNIKNSTFSNNSTAAPGYGGGAIAGKQFTGKLNVENSMFANNETLTVPSSNSPVGGEGGAFWFFNPSASASFNFTNNYFVENKAVDGAASQTGKVTTADGGAVALFNVLNGVNINFDSNTFDRNVAGDNAGAVMIQTNDSVTSGIMFKNNTFYKNIAQGTTTPTQSGGAVQLYANGTPFAGNASSADFISNTFAGNAVSTTGGAVATAGYVTNSISGNYQNNIFSDNKVAVGSEKTEGIAPGMSPSVDKGNNVGYDSNGTVPTLESGKAQNDPTEVFGVLPYKLIENSSQITAGSSNSSVIIPTIPIAPEKSADSKITDVSNIPVDQRDMKRESRADVGAVEISWIKYDSNGGTFNFDKLPDFYDGSVYYERLKTDSYYQVGYNPSTKIIPYGVRDLNATKIGYKFIGWSRKKDATEPDLDLQENKNKELNSSSPDYLYNSTVYAVWEKDTNGTDPVKGENVSVRYVDEIGNPVQVSGQPVADIVLGGYIGDTYLSEQKAFPDYTFKEMQAGSAPVSGTFTDKKQVITYVYTKNKLDPVVGANVIVRYVDEAGNPIQVSGQSVADITLNGNIGDTYTSEQKVFPDYTFKEMQAGSASVTGVFTDEEKIITYVYGKNNVAPDPKSNITVRYVDEDGKPVLVSGQPVADIILTGNIGDPYSSEQKEFEGYEFKEIPDYSATGTGVFNDKEQVVTYVYTKKSVTPKPAGNVIIRYRDSSGNPINVTGQLVADITLAGNEGETYTSEQKEFEGYTFLKMEEGSANPNGMFGPTQQVVTYMYTKKIIEPTKAANTTVRYLDENGSVISPEITLEGNIGDKYTSEKKVISGYTFKELLAGSAAVSGTFTDKDQIVTYVYTKNKVDPMSKSNVIIRYVDEAGNVVSKEMTLSGNVGDNYTSEKKVISGYTFKEMLAGSASVSGTFTNKEQIITYVYKKDIADPTTVTDPGNSSDASQPSLPSTGEKDSSIIMIIGATLFVFGLMFKLKKSKSN